jgi:drug/metabolite transporter (DMT)-like permease
MAPAVVYLVVILGQLLFAATPIFAKIALREFDPFTLGLLRFAIAIVMLNVLLLAQGRRIIPQAKHWPLLLFLGFVAVPVNQGLFLVGLKYTSPAHSALLYSLTPLIVYLLAIPILKEKPSLRKFAGILTALCGVIIVLLDSQIRRAPNFVLGDLLIFVAVIAWALFTVFGKPLVGQIGSLPAITYTMTVGTLLFVPIGLYPAATFDYGRASALSWFSLLYIAVLVSGVAYPLWYWALRRLEASKLTVFSNCQPILTAALSYFFFAEELTPNFLLGGALVLLGVFVTARA